MKRFIKSADLYVGQLVVVTDNKDAQVRTIAKIYKRESGMPHLVLLVWREGEKAGISSACWEPWTLMRPSIDQIETTISEYGPLVSGKFIKDLLYSTAGDLYKDYIRTTEEA